MIKKYLTYIKENKESVNFEIGDIVRVTYRETIFCGTIGVIDKIVFGSWYFVKLETGGSIPCHRWEIELVKKPERKITPEDPYGEENWQE